MYLEQNSPLHSISATSFRVTGSQSLTTCSLMPIDVIDDEPSPINRVAVSCLTLCNASNGLYGGGNPAYPTLSPDDRSDGNPSGGDAIGAEGRPVGLKANSSHSSMAKSLPEVASHTTIGSMSKLVLSCSPFSPYLLWKASSFESGLKTGLEPPPYGN